MDRELGRRVVRDPRELVEAVQDRGEEEPRQQQSRQQVLDVPEERVQRGDRERHPGDDAGEERPQRKREPHGIARLRELDQAQHDDDDQHDHEAHQVRCHDRQRDELPREAHLADEVRVLEQAPRRRLRCRGEEHPGGQPAEQEQPVVAALHRRDPPEQREHEQVDRHEDQRVQERPREPEDRAAVLRPKIAAKEAPEKLAIADDVRVDAHRRLSLRGPLARRSGVAQDAQGAALRRLRLSFRSEGEKHTWPCAGDLDIYGQVLRPCKDL